MNRHPSELSSHVLLVEGRDDWNVVSEICRRSRSVPDFDILDKGGIRPLLDSIQVEVRLPVRQVVGILTDANANLLSRWDAVSNRLKREGFVLPKSPDLSGIIIPETEDLPRVGIWLMPDNRSTGELEDFVAAMILCGRYLKII